MPLGQLPSWLNTSPELYLHAITAGSQAGLELAKIAQESDRAAENRSLAQQRLAQEQDMANARLAEMKTSGDETRDLLRDRIAAMRDLGEARNSRLASAEGQNVNLRQAALDLARQRAGETADYRDIRAGQFDRGLDIAENNYESNADMRDWRKNNPSLKDSSFVTLRTPAIPGRPAMMVRGNLKDPIDRASLRAAYGTNSIPDILNESNYPNAAAAAVAPVRAPVKPANKAAANIFNYNRDLGTLEPVVDSSDEED